MATILFPLPEAFEDWQSWAAEMIKAVGEGLDEEAIERIDSARFRGALVRLTADESIDTSMETIIPWDAEVYDTGSFWTPSSATRLTVPVSVTRVRLAANVEWAISIVNRRFAELLKNGVDTEIGKFMINYEAASDGAPRQNITSAVLSVIAGDYFELNVFQDSGGSLDVRNTAATWFSIEVIE